MQVHMDKVNHTYFHQQNKIKLLNSSSLPFKGCKKLLANQKDKNFFPPPLLLPFIKWFFVILYQYQRNCNYWDYLKSTQVIWTFHWREWSSNYLHDSLESSLEDTWTKVVKFYSHKHLLAIHCSDKTHKRSLQGKSLHRIVLYPYYSSIKSE